MYKSPNSALYGANAGPSPASDSVSTKVKNTLFTWLVSRNLLVNKRITIGAIAHVMTYAPNFPLAIHLRLVKPVHVLSSYDDFLLIGLVKSGCCSDYYRHKLSKV